MEISLNIILDEIEEFSPVFKNINLGSKFDSLGLLSTSETVREEDRLYIGMLSELRTVSTANAFYSIVIKDEALDDENIPDNSIIVTTELKITDFFELLQSRFMKIYKWSTKMDQYLIHKRSIQDVLNLSRDVIGNMITISDSSFSLVAYTEGIFCDDDITNNLIANGYHDQKAISIFNKNKLPEFWRNTTDIYVNDSCKVNNCPLMGKVIHYNNSYFSHIIMLCNHRRATPGLMDIFQILVDHMMVCFERQWIENSQMPHVYDSLILDLMSPNSYTLENLQGRAQNAGLPMEGYFKLLKITSDSGFNVMLQRLAQEIVSNIIQSRITQMQDQLIVLVILPDDKDKTFRNMGRILNNIMYEYRASCGVSDTFTNLSDLHIASEQADVALGYGVSTPIAQFSVGNNASETRVRSFENCYTRYLIAGQPANAHLAKHTKASFALEKLSEYDKIHGTNNLELLFIYLVNDRKATETSILMHMHRNNVIYRIGRIEELIGMNLEDSGVRFRLLIAYEIYTPKE